MQNAATANRIETAQWEQSASHTRPPRPWFQDLWLWILLVGPLVAPLFVALGSPILKPFADGIYLIGEAVCPKVGVHMMFLGEPVAVCFSCWASVWGLWVVRLLYGRAGEGFGPFAKLGMRSLWARWEGAPMMTRLGALSLGFMPWALDVMLWDLGAWDSPAAYMMLAGFLGGVTAGMLLLPAASAMRARVASRRTG
ncbi:MAG TPA: hypothetical protein VJ183_12210 [Chloroflexia bacterium]|nr:hypothetical protein [Chloroflexia bacterium]